MSVPTFGFQSSSLSYPASLSSALEFKRIVNSTIARNLNAQITRRAIFATLRSTAVSTK